MRLKHSLQNKINPLKTRLFSSLRGGSEDTAISCSQKPGLLKTIWRNVSLLVIPAKAGISASACLAQVGTVDVAFPVKHTCLPEQSSDICIPKQSLGTRSILLATVLTLLCTTALAHPISLSDAYVNVTENSITAKLSVLVEDLVLYQELEPNDENFLPPDVILEAMVPHGDFVLKHFHIMDVDGNPLEAELTKITPPEMEAEGVHVAYLMSYNIEYELEFKLDAPPTHLTFHQDFGGDKVFLPANMWLRLHRDEVKIEHERVLTKGIPYSVRIDWSGPPQAPLMPGAIDEDRMEKEADETLGINSYGAVYSFIYITDQEVRHEILMPLLSMEQWVPVERKDRAFLEVEEQDAAMDAILELFKKQNPVSIDGVRVQPVLDRLDFYGLDFTDFAVQAERKRVSTYSARVGIILAYPAKTPPQQVAMNWELFSSYSPVLRSLVYAYDDAATKDFYYGEDTFEWCNPGRPERPAITAVEAPPRPPKWALTISDILLILSLPMLIILSARSFFVPKEKQGKIKLGLLVFLIMFVYGKLAEPLDYAIEFNNPFAPKFTIAEEDAAAVFSTLHSNIYRAFDYRDESDVYDALAMSVEGKLLSDLYLQIRKGLEMAEQGGAVSHVDEVIIEEAKLGTTTNDPRAYTYTATWTVQGTVEHWGHLHTRTNRYTADFTTTALDSGWKITALKLLDEERLPLKTSIRKFKE